MMKRIIVALMILSLLAVTACEEISNLTKEPSEKSAPTNLEIVKAVKLSTDWQMKQMKFNLVSGGEVSILLKLADGDKVDGYFYLEKGDSVDFRITGKTLLHKSEASDRFSFTASQAQGDTYTLTFRNTTADDQKTKVTVFLEVIYAADGSIYIPVEQ